MFALCGDLEGGITTLVLARLPKEVVHEGCMACTSSATHEGYGLRKGEIFRLPLCDEHATSFDAYDGPVAKVVLERRSRKRPRRWISCADAKKLLGISQPQLWRWANANGVANEDGFYDEREILAEAKRRADKTIQDRMSVTRRAMVAHKAEEAGADWIACWEARTLLGMLNGNFHRWCKRNAVKRRPGLVWKADIMAGLQRRRERGRFQ